MINVMGADVSEVKYDPMFGVLHRRQAELLGGEGYGHKNVMNARTYVKHL